jgi:hypothetical protein
MCRNAKEILNVPEERFNKIKDAADSADGHKILRATEVIAKAESDLRYSVNGRITLETAVLKCAMPESDYNIDALMGRIALLEKKVEEGVKVQVSMAQPKVTQTVSPVKEPAQPVNYQSSGAVQPTSNKEPDRSLKDELNTFRADQGKSGNYTADIKSPEVKAKAPVTKIEEDASPFDNKPFDNNPFNQKPTSKPADTKTETVTQNEQPTLWEQPSVQQGAVGGGSLTEADKKSVFGKFLRAFRTTKKNAVLFTLCMDLESRFEGDKFVLFTPTEAVYKALTREENSKFIAETLATLGVFSHEIRLTTGVVDKKEVAFEKLKENFKGTDIQIK